jgi:ABC-2 type transport system ATP-binding protein
MKIEVKKLGKRFKNTDVLKDINLTFKSSNIYGLVGRNGSGKSVFLKILCGFYSPTKGEVLFDDVNYIENNGFPKNTRALIEKPSFLPDLSGLDNLKLLASIQNKIDEDKILKTLEDVNLISEKDKKYSEYSLGMKQKLGIAQVLMEDPDVIILDEPFNGVEELSVKKIIKILLEEKKNGKLIIISSHIKEDINSLADEVYLFDDGTVKNNK